MGLWYWWSRKQAEDNEEQYVNMGKEKRRPLPWELA